MIILRLKKSKFKQTNRIQSNYLIYVALFDKYLNLLLLEFAVFKNGNCVPT